MTLFLDGKSFAEATMVVARGVTLTGDERFVGFVETDTENDRVLTPFLRSLEERGLDWSGALLVVIDGGKGLRAAVQKALGPQAAVQVPVGASGRTWSVISPRGALARAVAARLSMSERPTYAEAYSSLGRVRAELEDRNQSAAATLAEGLEETLTLHRLGSTTCSALPSRPGTVSSPSIPSSRSAAPRSVDVTGSNGSPFTPPSRRGSLDRGQ